MENCFFSALPLAIILAVGCGGKPGDGKIPVIDVAGNLGTYRQIPMSEIISEVEYIPLETTPGSLLGDIVYLFVTQTHIIAASNQACHAFSREGKFITAIGRQGRGPGEWKTIISGVSVDETDKIVYIHVGDKNIEYTLDGRFVRETTIPRLSKEGYAVSNVAFLRDSLFMGHIHNHSGQEQHNWVIFDNNGNVVKAFDNHIQIEKDQFEAAIFSSTTPAMMSGDAYVKEQYNDTLYRLSPRNELVPAFVFDVGQYSFPLDLFLTQDNLMELYLKSAFISTYTTAESRMVVSRNNIFFDTWIGPNTGISTPAGNTSKKIVWGREIEDSDTNDVLGLYDIQSGKTELLDRDPVTRRMGLVNDIDGGLSFWPKYYNESADELVDVWEAYEMKDLLTEEYFAAHPAKDPAAHERLRALLKNLKETDNPVIVVARLK